MTRYEYSYNLKINFLFNINGIDGNSRKHFYVANLTLYLMQRSMGKITKLGDFENQNQHKTVIFKIKIISKYDFLKSKSIQN